MTFMRNRLLGVCLASGLACLASLPAMAQTLKLWSHWADQQVRVTFVEEAARKFEAANPGAKVEITWFQKGPLYAALKTALRADQAPDLFYAETDQIEYIDNGFLLDLSKDVRWENVEPWAKAAWTFDGKTYGLPLEAWTVELYFNKALMQRLGVTVPDGGAFSEAQFLDVVKKAAAAGVTPFVQGVGDRPFPGAFLIHEPLLKKLGKDDYGRLLRGELPWTDPRVVEALTFVKKVVDAGALPKDFTSLKHGEAHTYFHTNPGGLMFQMGSFYPARAFNPPDKGGQPKDFPLGLMRFPNMEGAACNACKTLAIGGSLVVNAASKSPKLAVAFLNTLATAEMGNKWLQTGYVQTGIKTDVSKLTGEHVGYFQDLSKINDGADYFIGLPNQRLAPKPREAFAQIMNVAFPAGLLSLDQAVKQMQAAR